jgi:hypothetical protein
LLPKFVKADEFIVYVPESEVETFKDVTNPEIHIETQASLDTGYGQILWDQIESKGNQSRFGWYLQQFYKIEALFRSPADVTIIWDADCVPVKPIRFINDDKQLLYMKASENHSAYFEVIERLLGFTKVQDQSFVIPGFPILGLWVRELKHYVEQRNFGQTWAEAIISNTDLSLKSGFSETETLGTWVANSYPNRWKTVDLNWERFGQSRFNYAKNLQSSDLIKFGELHALDIISFENWDSRGIRLFVRRGKSRFIGVVILILGYVRSEKRSNET